jgi:FecR-like protein
VDHTSLVSRLLSAVVACAALLGGCAGVCIGGICLNAESQPGIPLLYADAGVQVERSPGGSLPYQPGMALQSGDVIQTAEGFAVVDFDDGNIVALRTNTRIRLGSITLFLGEVFARIGQIAARGGGQVTTDELSASVKGTEYSVRRVSLPDGAELASTSVIVRRGTVTCDDRGAGRWPAVAVTEDRIFRVEGKQLPQPPQYVDSHAETQWADTVIQRLLVPRTAAPRPEFGVSFPAGPPPRRQGPSRPTPTSPPTREGPSPPPPSRPSN